MSAVRAEPAMGSATTSGALTLTPVGAVLLMALIGAAGASIDLVTGTGLRRYFAVSVVVGAGLGTLMVRRNGLWTAVITPPLLYVLTSAVVTFSTGDRTLSTEDFASYLVTWLVYGFPEIAAATGLAMVIAGIRLTRKRPGMYR